MIRKKTIYWISCGLVILLRIPTIGEEVERNYSSIQDLLNADRLLLEERFLDSSSELVLNEDGYALEKDEYNEKDQLICKSYYGTEEEPVFVGKFGYSKIIYAYDEDGNVSNTWYYDENGDSVVVGNAAHLVREFDENKNIISEAYFGTNDEAVLAADGYHCVKSEFDDEKHKLSDQYFDLDGNPIVMNKGYASVKHVYDEAWNVSDTWYYDENGDPIVVGNAAHLVREFDENKNIISESYFGTEDEAVLAADGYQCVKSEYDEEAGNAI